MTTCRVIQMIDRQIINTCVYEEMPVRDYVIGNRVEDDILKLAVVERYGKTGTVGRMSAMRPGVMEPISPSK